MAQLSQKDVLKLVKDKTGVFKTDLKLILDAIDESLLELLSLATPENPVEIKLFSGFVIKSEGVGEREAKDPRTGEVIIARQKIKTSVKLTRSFKERVEVKAGLIDKIH